MEEERREVDTNLLAHHLPMPLLDARVTESCDERHVDLELL